MNGTISQLHKGGRTNKTSNQRPVVLLNSGYQLLDYIINEQLKRIVEQMNLLEPGQGGGRQGRSAKEWESSASQRHSLSGLKVN